jgi:hypothetical protein
MRVLSPGHLSSTRESGGNAVTYSGEGKLPEYIFWDGQDGSQGEGFYTASFRVEYNNGSM